MAARRHVGAGLCGTDRTRLSHSPVGESPTVTDRPVSGYPAFMSDQPEVPPELPSPPAPPVATPSDLPPAPVPPDGAAPGPGKSRILAIVLALLLGGLGIHKFYLGKVAQGILYILFVWTGIPSFIAWIEALVYLTRSNEEWAAQHGGPVERPSGVAIGCLWILALLPLLGGLVVILMIFFGGAITSVSY
jgi:TM2 domain-containing membrane protein YozV